jgi:hypothetical protein
MLVFRQIHQIPHVYHPIWPPPDRRKTKAQTTHWRYFKSTTASIKMHAPHRCSTPQSRRLALSVDVQQLYSVHNVANSKSKYDNLTPLATERSTLNVEPMMNNTMQCFLSQSGQMLKRLRPSKLLLAALCAMWASQHGLPSVHAQVVQLPSQHAFSSSGAVWVPDGGTAYLGGSGYSSQGSTQSGFGPLSNRATGRSSGGSSMSVSVQIIDLEALDEAILASATPHANAATITSISQAANSAANNLRSNGTSATTAKPIDAPSRGTPQTAALLSRAQNPRGTSDLADSSNTSQRIDADPTQWVRVLAGPSSAAPAQTSLLESDIRYYVQQGEAADKAGRTQSARVYYQLARQAMTPELIDRYQRIMSARTAEAAARAKAEQQDGRRKF